VLEVSDGVVELGALAHLVELALASQARLEKLPGLHALPVPHLETPPGYVRGPPQGGRKRAGRRKCGDDREWREDNSGGGISIMAASGRGGD
jgi:hypothetical protein